VFKNRANKGEVIGDALSGGLFYGAIGGLVGYITGTRRQAEYPGKVENAVLRQRVEALESDKSFTKALLQEKIDAAKDKDCGCRLRN
jgi:hypothetical protein